MRNDPRMHRAAPRSDMFTNHTPPDAFGRPAGEGESSYRAGGEMRPADVQGGSGGDRGGHDLLRAGEDATYSQRGANQRGRGPRGYARSDERVREEVCECLTDDPDLDASGIEVRVLEGKVMLDGVLPQRWLKHHAENLASQCRGVREVENNIRVVKQDRTGDASQADFRRYGPHGKSFGAGS